MLACADNSAVRCRKSCEMIEKRCVFDLTQPRAGSMLTRTAHPQVSRVSLLDAESFRVRFRWPRSRMMNRPSSSAVSAARGPLSELRMDVVLHHAAPGDIETQLVDANQEDAGSE